MIISYPTSLYSTELPDGTESGNITWYISSNNPPSKTDTSMELPVAELIRPLPSKIYNNRQFRSLLGEFAFNVSAASNSDIGSNKKQYEIGQILEFVEETDVSIDVTKVPDVIDIQQDTNILDYSDLGLTDEEVELLSSKSTDVMDKLINDINTIKESINNKKLYLRELKKKENELNKAINASNVALGDDSEISIKLSNTKSDVVSDIYSTSQEINKLSSDVEYKYNKLLEIREMVR